MATSPNLKGYVSSGKQDTNYDFYNGSTWTQLGSGGDGYAPTWFDRQNFTKFFYKANSSFYNYDVSSNTSSALLNAGCLQNPPNVGGTDLDQIFQYPLYPYQNHFWAKKGGDGKIYFSNAANHSTDYKLVDDLAVYSIGKLLIPTHNPSVLYTTPNCPAFWNEPSRIYKVYTNTYSPTNCSLVTCNASNGLCKDTIKYFPNEKGQNFFPATSIAVSSSNPSKMWVALSYDKRWFGAVKYAQHVAGNPTQGWNVNTRFQLRKTTDNGLTWNGDSLGLPQYPIRHLVYVDGSNDAMFCATANGRIFYKNANLTQWQEVNPNLPRSPISKLEINYCTKRLYVATFGRGIYYVDLNGIPAHTNQALEITTDQLWTSNYYDIGGDIIVKAGKTLTIYAPSNGCVVNMSKDSKIVVERGAKLITNGVTFTNSCGEFWQGIHVWGDNTKRQVHIDSLADHPSLQGVCLLTSSTLEYMNSGVRMGNAVLNPAFNGGQLVANQVQFKNNNMSILFLPYNPPYAANNTQAYVKSKIMRCNFDNEIIPSVQLYQHVFLNGVKGVSIEGNYFKNSLNTTTYPLATSRGYGIYSTDATFIALQYDNQEIRNNKFEGLTYGIAAQFTGALNYPYGVLVGCKVNKAEFVGNRYGLYITGGSIFHKLTENTFEVPSILNNPSYGMYVEGTMAYKVEENTLTATGTTGANYNTYGILISNNSANDETVRRNTLSNFRYGLVAVGKNSSQTQTPTETGLQFRCNTLDKNLLYDIYVDKRLVNGVTTTGSIRYNQGNTGSNASLANNRFYQINPNPPGVPLFQLFRENSPSTNFYKYLYPNVTNFVPFRAPLSTQLNHIEKQSIAVTNLVYILACPVNIVPEDYQPSLINQWNGQINAMRQSIDGGDKNSLQQELAQASPYDIDGVYEELLGKEALSEEILAAAINQPYAEYGLEKLKEVIVKNSGLRDTVIDVLLARQLPYTSVDITEMEQAQTKQSPQDEIGSEIARTEERIEKNMVAWSEKYAEENKPDSVKLMLKLYENESSLSRYARVALLWGLHDEASIAAEKSGDTKLKEYIGLAKENHLNNISWKDVDASTVNQLWSIYASSSAASASAKAALGIILDSLIAPYIPQSDLISFKHENMLANKWEQMRKVGVNHFVVSPNPATQQFSITCSLASSTFIEIKCYDQSGKLVLEKRSEGKQLNIPIDCQGWQNGIYLIKGIDGNNQRYFAKVTVQH